MKTLAEELIASRYLATPALIEAFRSIDRKDFVATGCEAEAYEDYPLPIGFGQTISQPLTVAFMLEHLELAPGQRVLDIGYGSGWQTALIAQTVGEKGKVFALEVVSELAAFGKKNIAKYNFIEREVVTCITRNAKDGLAEEAPFDRIIAAAALTESVPSAWKEQLAPEGIILAPIRDALLRLTKQRDGAFHTERYPGFAFVPFVE